MQNPKLHRTKSVVALWLTFLAGFVDIVGFLTVYKLFTAHMTGTTVQIAEHLVHRNWHDAAIAGGVVGVFFLGSILGRAMLEIGSRVKLRRIGSVTLAIEAASLVGAVLFGVAGNSQPEIFLALAMLAFAMGLQTATLTGIGPLTIHTTFVTGMLNKLAQLLAKILFRTYDLNLGDLLQAHAGSSQEEHRRQRLDHVREARFIFAIWLLYLLGAASGTWSADHWQLKSLYIPCCMLLVAIAIDQWRPFSIEEEREQGSEV